MWALKLELLNSLVIPSCSRAQTQFPSTPKAWAYNDYGLWFVRHCQASTSLFFSKMCWLVLLWEENNHFMTLIWNRGSVVWLSQLSNPWMTKKANIGTSFCSCLRHILPELICSIRVSCLPVLCSDFWADF